MINRLKVAAHAHSVMSVKTRAHVTPAETRVCAHVTSVKNGARAHVTYRNPCTPVARMHAHSGAGPCTAHTTQETLAYTHTHTEHSTAHPLHTHTHTHTRRHTARLVYVKQTPHTHTHTHTHTRLSHVSPFRNCNCRLRSQIVESPCVRTQCRQQYHSCLQQACGYEFTNKLHRMFTDIGISADLNTTFAEKMRKESVDLGINFSILILQVSRTARPLLTTSQCARGWVHV